MDEWTEAEKKFSYPKLALQEEPSREAKASALRGRHARPTSSSPAQPPLLSSEHNQCQRERGAQSMGQTWTVVLSGKTETEAGSLPCDLEMSHGHGLREKRIHGNSHVKVTTCAQGFRLSKQSGECKASHKWVPRNLILAVPLTLEYVPTTCPSLGGRLSLIYLEQNSRMPHQVLEGSRGKGRELTDRYY